MMLIDSFHQVFFIEIYSELKYVQENHMTFLSVRFAVQEVET